LILLEPLDDCGLAPAGVVDFSLFGVSGVGPDLSTKGSNVQRSFKLNINICIT
jgi:hypothetical protein